MQGQSRIAVVKRFFGNQSILLILVLLVVVMSFLSDSFLTLGNLFNIARQVAVLGIIACGMTIVIIAGLIDLSVGSILSLVMAVMIRMQGYGYAASLFAGLACGAICGLINGILIGRYRANFFMATLSTMFLYQGITLLVDGGYNLKGSRDLPYTFIGQSNILGIPAMIYVLIPLALLSALLLRKTPFGRRLYAVGLNSRAAFAAGVNTSAVTLLAYVISGIACGAGGIVLVSRLTMAQPAAGAPYLFDIVTAVILGGTSMSGGFGSIYKTVIGFILLGVINNGMALLGVPFEYQQMVKGLIFIFAVVYDEFMKRKRLS